MPIRSERGAPSPSGAQESSSAGGSPTTEPAATASGGDVGPVGGSGEALSDTHGRIDAVVDEYGPAVYRLARSIVRDDALADDVTQETFIKVWRQLDTFRGDGSMRAWVLRIAHNTAVSTLRRIRDSAMPPDQLPARADPVGVHRVVEGRAALDELRDALDGLDDVSAAAVVLREVEGLSYDEIAEALAVPLPTVKTRLLRARRQLRVSMQEWRS